MSAAVVIASSHQHEPHEASPDHGDSYSHSAGGSPKRHSGTTVNPASAGSIRGSFKIADKYAAAARGKAPGKAAVQPADPRSSEVVRHESSANVNMFMKAPVRKVPLKKRLEKMFLEPINPEMPWKIKWDLLIIVFVLYNAITVPIAICFPESPYEKSADQVVSKSSPETLVTVFDIIVDFFFLYDVVLTLRTGYENESGDLVMEKESIRKRYYKGMFIFDMLASIPIELIILLYTAALGTGVSQAEQLQALGLIKCVRLLRLSRLQKYIRKMESSGLIQLFVIAGEFYLGAHFVGCIFHLIGWMGRMEGDGGLWVPNHFEGSSWFDGVLHEQDAIWVRYITSLYWAFTTLTTVGYGDLLPANWLERAYGILVMLLGTFLYGSIIGTMTTVIAQWNISQNRYNDKIASVSSFLKDRHFPRNIQTRVLEYYDFLWSRHKAFKTDGDTVLDEVPMSLKMEMIDYMHERLFTRNELFAFILDEPSVRSGRGFCQQLALKFATFVAMPGEYIFEEGDKSDGMYVVAKGEVQLTVPSTDPVDPVVLAVREEGGHFGDADLFAGIPINLAEDNEKNSILLSEAILELDANTPPPRSIEAFSNVFSDVHKLYTDDLAGLAERFPDEIGIMVKIAKARHTKLHKRRMYDDDRVLMQSLQQCRRDLRKKIVPVRATNSKPAGSIPETPTAGDIRSGNEKHDQRGRSKTPGAKVVNVDLGVGKSKRRASHLVGPNENGNDQQHTVVEGITNYLTSSKHVHSGSSSSSRDARSMLPRFPSRRRTSLVRATAVASPNPGFGSTVRRVTQIHRVDRRGSSNTSDANLKVDSLAKAAGHHAFGYSGSSLDSDSGVDYHRNRRRSVSGDGEERLRGLVERVKDLESAQMTMLDNQTTMLRLLRKQLGVDIPGSSTPSHNVKELGIPSELSSLAEEDIEDEDGDGDPLINGGGSAHQENG